MNKKNSLYSIIFAGFTALFVYLYFFQVPDVISKRYLLFSVLIGLIAGVAFWVMSSNEKQKSRNLIVWPVMLCSLLASIMFIVRFNLPNNYLLAHRVQVEISIPAEVDGGKEISIQAVKGDVQTLWHSAMPLADNLRAGEDVVFLLPDNQKVSTLNLQIRAWERVVFLFSEIPPDVPVLLKVNTRVERLYAPENPEGTILSVVPIDGFWKTQLLSDITGFLSVFCVFYLFFLYVDIYHSLRLLHLDFKKILLVFFVIFVFLSYIPLHPERSYVTRDSGVFLYTAKGLLSGETLYQDNWDHKGPMIYFVNALGLIIGNGRLGLWLIETVTGLLSLILIYKLLSTEFNGISAILGSAVFCHLYFRFLIRGNFAEEFAFPSSLLALSLFAKTQKQPFSKNRILFLLIGCLFGFNFLLRPDLISPFAAIILVVMISGVLKKRYAWTFKTLLWILLGFAAVLFVVSLYFVIQGVFLDFIHAVFVYNFAYSNPSASTGLVQNIFWGFGKLPFFMTLALLGWGAFAVYFHKQQKNSKSDWVLAILIGFLIQLVLYNFSGRNYNHYVLSLLPYVCLLSSAFIPFILKSRPLKSFVDWEIVFKWTSSILLVIFIAAKLVTLIQTEPVRKNQQDELLAEINQYLSPGDTLFIWGAETATNYLLDVPAPTRYNYIYPLMNCDYIREEDVSDFIADIEEKRPVLIDSAETNPEVSPLNLGNRSGCKTIDPIFTYFEDNYVFFTQLSNGWIVYKMSGN